MVSRDRLKNIKNILELNNDKALGIDKLYNILTAINDEDDTVLLKTILDLCDIPISASDINKLYDILTAIKQEDDTVFLKTILDLCNNDTKLIEIIFKAIKHEPEYEDDILDSVCDSQAVAKRKLVDDLDKLNLLNKETEVVIFGCWYGSILIPLLHDKVKSITAIDIDDHAIAVGQNRFFSEYDNVDWITADIFEDYKALYDSADIFINTSCENMKPMYLWGPIGPRSIWKENPFITVDWLDHKTYKIPWWDRVKPSAHFAFTSHNMFDIHDSFNCVSSLLEFKGQLPPKAKVVHEDEITDERGTRFTIIGKV